MKKILHLFIIGLLAFSCSKDETEDNPDFEVSSDYYFAATIDDNTIVFQHGIDGYYNGTTSGFTTTPSGYQEDYGTVFMNGFTTANSAGIFFSKTFSEPGNCSDMVQTFGEGSVNFGMPSLSEDENGIDGGVIYYVDNNGVLWSSGLSPATQNSSAFEITEYVDLDLPIASKVVKAKFNCTLYDGNGNSKTIRNGEARAMVFSCN